MNNKKPVKISPNQKKLTMEDLYSVNFLSSPSISSDRNDIAYSVYSADRLSGEFFSRIYCVDVIEGLITSLPSYEDSHEWAPSFSPKGQTLAFISNRTGQPQIWLIKQGFSGSPKQLTSLRHGVDEFRWSPDGNQIVFTTKRWPTEDPKDFNVELTVEEKSKWDDTIKHTPIIVEKLVYKHDKDKGIFDGSHTQIGIVKVETKETTLLANELYNHTLPYWSPDNKKLVFYGFPYQHHEAFNSELFTIEIETKTTKQITEGLKACSEEPIFFAEYGEKIIYCAYSQNEDRRAIKELYIIPIDGQGKETKALLPEEYQCHGVNPLSVGKTVYGETNGSIQMSQSGDYLYFISGWKGCTHLFRLNIKNPEEVEQVTSGKISVHSFCQPDENKAVYVRGDFNTIGEIFILNLQTGEEKQLTFANKWINNYVVIEPVELWVPSEDEEFLIHGWVIPPVKINEKEKYPAVLYIHGGPNAYFTTDFNLEFQALAACGFTVVYCDPRGSSGYGPDFEAGKYAWGDESYNDLMTFLDEAIKKFSYIDSESLGVTGGSYGGHMTNRILGKTNRFDAAVTQRTLSNLATSYGTGDIGFVSAEKEQPKSLLDYLLNRVKKSPITKIDKFKTPLLILHGEKDFRCSMEQAEQLFVAMKDRNPDVPVRMVIFPDENHEITRSGKAHFQVQHFNEIASWFEKHLIEKEPSNNEK